MGTVTQKIMETVTQKTKDALPKVSWNYCIYVVEPSFFAEKCITGWIPCIMHSLSLLTCQYIRPNKSKSTDETRQERWRRYCITTFMIVLIAVFAIFAIMISIFPACAFLAGWIECPYQYGTYDICFTLKQHGSTPLIGATTTDNTTKSRFKE